MQLIVQHNNKIISNTTIDKHPKVGDVIVVKKIGYFITVISFEVETNSYIATVLSISKAKSIIEQNLDTGIIKLIKLGVIG